MAVSTQSAFRPGRKPTLTASTGPFPDHANGSAVHAPSPVPPSPSPRPMQPYSSASSSAWNASTSSITSSTTLRNPNDGGIGSSLIAATGPGGVTLSAGAPVAANTIGNKPAMAGSSLYQACLALLDRLWCVPTFGDKFLTTTSSGESPDERSTDADPAPSSKPKISSADPVTQLWQCFRLGAPLCWLFNQLDPAKELPINPDANRSNANECKRQVAKFIIGLNSELGWDPDDIFTVSQLYLNDTNGFVKVVRTISKLLDVFESRGLLMEAPKSATADELDKPTDDRAWIVRELLDTERKYVQDLEVLQNYARALGQNNIVPPDTIHSLFGNLNMLVDVQRRFLICVEENVRRPADDQHFGHVFRTMESDFAVYEPFCANYAQALDIINAEASNLTRLRGLPGSEDCFLDPSYELPTFLIKPVQRICKYPLLLESLLKKTPSDATYYQELVDGLQVIRRITDKVNETRRLQENIQLVRDLEARVEDWKGHNIATFGNLLLSDVFMVSKSETEREYHVYLFEKILLCCKEILPMQPKKNSKSNSLLKQKSSVAPTPPGKKPRTTLQLKGRIFINNVTSAIPNSKIGAILGTGAGGQYALQVWWRGDVDQESFSLRCKNEEQLRQWQAVISRLIEEVSLRRQHVGALYGQQQQGSGVASPSLHNMAGAGANGRRSGSVSQSLFPQTPSTDLGPVYPFSRTDSQAGIYRTPDEEYMSESNAHGAAFDGSQNGTLNGRGTPLGGRYSQPAEQRERQASLSVDARPRARTEDQDSSILTQWRSHSPAIHPPLPRNSSTSSTGEHAAVSGLQQLRKASSSRQLRQGQAHPHAFPRPPVRPSDTSDVEGSSVDQMENLTMSGGVRSRADSSSSRGTMSSDMHHSRNRTTSNPSAYGAASSNVPPPMPRGPYVGHNIAAQALGGDGLYSTAIDKRQQRFSSSSVSTVDSQRSSHSRPGSTAASSPITHGGSGNGSAAVQTGAFKVPQGSFAGPRPVIHPSSFSNQQQNPYQQQQQQQQQHQQGDAPAHLQVQQQHHPQHQQSHQPTPPHSNAVKLVIHHGDDKLVVVVLSTVSLAELTEKVTKKIRLVSGRRVDNLKIRYVDEDGDRILMHDNDDVQMAFEASRQQGTDVDLVVTS